MCTGSSWYKDTGIPTAISDSNIKSLIQCQYMLLLILFDEREK